MSQTKQDLDRRLKFVTSIIALSIAVVAMALTFYSGLLEINRPPKAESALLSEVKSLREDVAKQANEIRQFSKSVAAIQKLPPPSEVSVQLGKLQGDLSNVGERVGRIEGALLKNPETALSVPLLRQDLESLRDQYVHDRETSAKYMDRIYDQNKWFIGLMFSMALGLIGLAVSNFLQARKAPEEK